MITSRDPRDRVSRAVTSGRVLSVATSVSPVLAPTAVCVVYVLHAHEFALGGKC